MAEFERERMWKMFLVLSREVATSIGTAHKDIDGLNEFATSLDAMGSELMRMAAGLRFAGLKEYDEASKDTQHYMEETEVVRTIQAYMNSLRAIRRPELQ